MSKQKKQNPSILSMLKTFAKEVTEYAKEGAPNVDEAEYQKRLETCGACPHFKEDVMRCGKCGCLVEHKAKWATSSCPDKRWTKFVVNKKGEVVEYKEKKKKTKWVNDGKGNFTKASE